MAMMIECEVCGEQTETEHEHEVVVVRQGAAVRTGDELSEVFIEDVCGLLELPLPPLPAFETDTRSGLRWLTDEEDTETMLDLTREYEGKLGERGYSVVWDDGYVIFKVGPCRRSGSSSSWTSG